MFMNIKSDINNTHDEDSDNEAYGYILFYDLGQTFLILRFYS